MNGDQKFLNPTEYMEQAEKFQEHFVKPLIDAMRAEIAPLRDQASRTEKAVETVTERVDTLESHEKKALVGWTALVLAVSTCGTSLWQWFKSALR